MAPNDTSMISKLLEKNRAKLLNEWLAGQGFDKNLGTSAEAELREQATRFIQALQKATENSQLADIRTGDWAPVREVLEEVSRMRALRGATPSETASFVFSLKQPLFQLLVQETGATAANFSREVWVVTELLDKLGLYTMEVFQKNREEVIARQQVELLELSTPVVKLWTGILALPLIGTLDSGRTQIVMENLLQEIVSSGAEIAIIDITGVPTVDTLVAQHLLKTVSAARLMGADCIISGIRPQIAQTIVHLGLELDVVSKATMADAFALALRRMGKAVVTRTRFDSEAKSE